MALQRSERDKSQYEKMTLHSKHTHANWFNGLVSTRFSIYKKALCICIYIVMMVGIVLLSFTGATSGLFARNCTFVDIPCHKYCVHGIGQTTKKVTNRLAN